VEYQKKTIEELENLGTKNKDKNAIYILGRKLIEGCMLYNNPINEKKGITWLKENAKNGHAKSEEYLGIFLKYILNSLLRHEIQSAFCRQKNHSNLGKACRASKRPR
jgi:hypothetical protein